jgi:hypothetical protein
MINKIKLKIFIALERFLKIKEKYELNVLKNKFKGVGSNFNLKKDYRIKNPQYIEIGNNFSAGDRFRIEAWDRYGQDNFAPSI